MIEILMHLFIEKVRGIVGISFNIYVKPNKIEKVTWVIKHHLIVTFFIKIYDVERVSSPIYWGDDDMIRAPPWLPENIN